MLFWIHLLSPHFDSNQNFVLITKENETIDSWIFTSHKASSFYIDFKP